MKGSENINGLKVGFVLEGGYDSTNGKSDNEGRLFGRETLVYLSGDYGTLYAGRMHSLLSDGGSINMAGGKISALDTGSFAPGYHNGISLFARNDSTIAYRSPVLNGFQFGAQASNVDTTGGSSTKDRYFAVATSYTAGNFAAFLGGDLMNKKSAGLENVDDAFTVLAGANYNFGFVKPYLSVMYFKHLTLNEDLKYKTEDIKIKDAEGYTVTLSAEAPVLGGTLRGSVAYTDGEDKTPGVDDNDFKKYGAGVEYYYNLSKSTRVYGGLGYSKNDTDKANIELETYTAGAGLVYYF